MSSLRTHALILRHIPDREHDRQLIILTAHNGQQRLRARGTKKSAAKLGGSLEPIAEVDLVLANGRRQDVVTGGVILEPFRAVHQDLVALISAQWLAELVERVATIGHGSDELYQLLRRAWIDLASQTQWPAGRRWLALCRWAWRILTLEGFAPSIEHCAGCHRPLAGSDVASDPARGLVHLTEAGPGSRRIASASLEFFQGRETTVDSRTVFRDVHRLLETVLHRTIERPLHSERVLRQVMRLEQLSVT